MIRIIVVIDVELRKQDQNLREQVMKLVLLKLLKGETISGPAEIKKTHMHGLRLVIKSEKKLREVLENPKNAPDQEKIQKLEFETHSVSNYASIFFVKWPMTNLAVLP